MDRLFIMLRSPSEYRDLSIIASLGARAASHHIVPGCRDDLNPPDRKMNCWTWPMRIVMGNDKLAASKERRPGSAWDIRRQWTWRGPIWITVWWRDGYMTILIRSA